MSTATDMLAKYMAAEQAILDGKEARWGDRMLRMEDLSEIRKGRQEWEARVRQEASPSAAKVTNRIGGATFSVARLDG
ncbi:hypothetical protein [Dechloromonas sp. TW-R-39-2]|uniref:hypothetical protein n=1 Tax=Dechloromonas sp. TW-R-39-2 TaxID=2654218 RepID=UPI00193EB8B4|nr:hypothetical protein [Dechloromonas sp. TW-R-39-2]